MAMASVQSVCLCIRDGNRRRKARGAEALDMRGRRRRSEAAEKENQMPMLGAFPSSEREKKKKEGGESKASSSSFPFFILATKKTKKKEKKGQNVRDREEGGGRCLDP